MSIYMITHKIKDMKLKCDKSLGIKMVHFRVSEKKTKLAIYLIRHLNIFLEMCLIRLRVL